MRSFQKGAWDNVVDSSINMYFGHIQIHKKGFQDEQTIDNSFEITDSIYQHIARVPWITNVSPRLESFALASAGKATKGVLVLGIRPKLEDQLTHLSRRVTSGNYIDEQSKGILIAEGLAKKMHLNVQDTLVLISQGYHGVNSAGKYPVSGIVKYPIPDLNKSLVFLSLFEAQEFYGADKRLTSLALQVQSENKVGQTKKALRESFNDAYFEILDFEELMPDLLQARQLDELGAYLILFILYCLVGFTIMGTVLMMTKKRSYEFGVLLAIGLKRKQLFITVFIEIVLQAVIGIMLGILFTLPIAIYFHNNPINMNLVASDAAKAFEVFGVDPVFAFSLSPSIFIYQSLVIFCITLLLSVYPLITIYKLQPVEAMRE